VSSLTVYLTNSGEERLSQHQVCPKDFSQIRGFIFLDLCTKEREAHDRRPQAIGLFESDGYLLPNDVGSLLGCTTDLVSEAPG
jgi:hypothetical protein